MVLSARMKWTPLAFQPLERTLVPAQRAQGLKQRPPAEPVDSGHTPWTSWASATSEQAERAEAITYCSTTYSAETRLSRLLLPSAGPMQVKECIRPLSWAAPFQQALVDSAARPEPPSDLSFLTARFPQQSRWSSRKNEWRELVLARGHCPSHCQVQQCNTLWAWRGHHQEWA